MAPTRIIYVCRLYFDREKVFALFPRKFWGKECFGVGSNGEIMVEVNVGKSV